jgi:hypothetical protein
MKVQDMCTKGNAEACKRVKFTETGSFAGGIRGGALAGVLTVPLVGWTLRALTVSTRCLGGGWRAVIVVVVDGYYAGGVYAGKGGEVIGGLYTSMRDDSGRINCR